MKAHSNKKRSRNVTMKDLLSAVIVIAVLLPLYWLREVGVKWASFLISLIPVVGYFYWLKVSRQKSNTEDAE